MFSFLIVAFVLYKSGYFDGSRPIYPSSPNGSALIDQVDTIPNIDSLNRIKMMSSSKVLILKEHSFRTDETPKTITDSTLKEAPLIYGSKSAIILYPKDVKKMKIDSIMNDSLKKE